MSILPYVFVWVFVMYMFVRMTIHISMGFRHVHVCTDDYPYYYWFCHVHVCTNDYPFLFNGFSSCTCLYEWLSISFEWIVVMHIYIRMTTISFWMDSCHVHYCMNDYHLFLKGFSSFTFLYKWLPFLFEWIVVMHISVRMTTISFWMDSRHIHFCTNDYHFVLYGFSSCILCAMTFHILLVFHDVCNALQRVNSMEQWRIINNFIMYIGFWPCA